MAHTLQISDGTTTIDFLSSNYKVLLAGGWAPRVARRRLSLLGGRSPYEDVIEEMAIQVKGTSESDCLSKLNALVSLLDQAHAWSMGENERSADVYIEYEPPNTALAGSVKAPILGPPPGEEFITLPRDFEFILTDGRYRLGHESDPVILRFLRYPLWLRATETKAAGTTTGNPVIATTATFTNTMKALVPYDIDVTFSGVVGSSDGMPDIYVLTSNEADKLYTIEAESMTGGSSTADSNASAGNVHQAADSTTTTLTDSAFALDANARRFAFWAVVKASGTTTQWTAQATLYYDDTISETSAAGLVATANQVTTAQIIELGEIVTGWQPGRLAVVFTPDANNGENLKIDYLCGIALDDSANILRVNSAGSSFVMGDHERRGFLSGWHPLLTACRYAAA